MVLHSAGLVLFCALQVAIADELSCDFKRPCCWQSLDEGAEWQIRSGRSININDYRITFIVGRSRLPPVGNYLMQSGDKTPTSYGSCSFCSSDGEVNVQYRHWQSPAAQMKLCWRRWGQPIRNENCYLAEPSRQSQIISQNLVVPRGKDIQVLFVMEKEEGAINAIVMIDRILLSVKPCGSSELQRAAGFTSQSMRVIEPSSMSISEQSFRTDNQSSAVIAGSHLSSSRQLDLAQLALVNERIRTKLVDRQKGRMIIRQMLSAAVSSKRKDYKKQLGEVAGSSAKLSPVSSKKDRLAEDPAITSEFSPQFGILSSAPTKKLANQSSKRHLPELPKKFSSSSRLMPPPSPPAQTEDFDPLTDLLGKELVEFLDPNYVSVDDEEDFTYDEKDVANAFPVVTPLYSQQSLNKSAISKVKHESGLRAPIGPTVVQTPSILTILTRPLSLLPPQPCQTTGGCLFDRSMCSYTHPLDIPRTSHFDRLKVGVSSFIRARVPPGTSSILQTDTYMNEPHTVFFDALEWKNGARLVGCCGNINGEQTCPFATPFEAGVLLWQSASFDCPARTVRIRFICENFGREEAECGIDSIRIHRLSDTFLLEPCQKNILSSL